MLPKDSYNLVVVHGLARSGHKSVLEEFVFRVCLFMPFGLPANSRRRPLFSHTTAIQVNRFWSQRWGDRGDARWQSLHAVTLGFGPASVFRAFLSSAGLKTHLNRNRCASSTFRTAGPALPRTQRGGCRRKGQAQPAGSKLPHLKSGGVAPGM